MLRFNLHSHYCIPFHPVPSHNCCCFWDQPSQGRWIVTLPVTLPELFWVLTTLICIDVYLNYKQLWCPVWRFSSCRNRFTYKKGLECPAWIFVHRNNWCEMRFQEPPVQNWWWSWVEGPVPIFQKFTAQSWEVFLSHYILFMIFVTP